jgi:hypothetical protein
MNSSLQQLRQHGIEIRHYIPGRLRFTVDLRSNAALAEKIIDILGKVPGVTKVECHSSSNSVLVMFNPVRLALPENTSRLLAALQQLFPSVGVDVWQALWSSGG